MAPPLYQEGWRNRRRAFVPDGPYKVLFPLEFAAEKCELRHIIMCNRGAIIRRRPVLPTTRAARLDDTPIMIRNHRFVFLAGIPLLLSACAKELPPSSVDDFVENPILLEATMVRCAENRSQTKYDAECVNARDAVNRIAAGQEKARRAELEAQSEQKRQALRRTQEAAAEARQRAVEAQRLRDEAVYLGQFGAAPTDGTAAGAASTSADGSTSGAAGNAAGVTVHPMPQAEPDDAGTESPTDLEAIREELKRRQDESQ
jgi:hypothetical protein